MQTAAAVKPLGCVFTAAATFALRRNRCAVLTAPFIDGRRGMASSLACAASYSKARAAESSIFLVGGTSVP